MCGRTNLKRGLVIVILVGFCAIASGKVIYVDAGRPGGDGQTWPTAYKYLQDALAAAMSGDEIRVAEGAYKPDQGGGKTPGDRTATFQLKNGVAIYGGYAGYYAADPDKRDVELYKTTLSGDLSGNDAEPSDDPLNEPTRGENSYHVVTGSGTNATAVLDGFTITAGNANGAYPPDNCGSGMDNRQGSPTVTNCTFSWNSTGGHGGGMNNEDGSPTVTNCTFSGNWAQWNGSGMLNAGMFCNPTVTNCTFIKNSAGAYGGGMANGGGNPTVTNCAFIGNSAYGGGGMFNWSYNAPKVTNCTFSGNSAKYLGGGMHNDTSFPTVTNCTFSGNSASHGGGMYNAYRPTLINSIFWGNSDDSGLGESAQIYGTSTVTYCCIQGLDTYSGGTGNIGDDPLFVDADGPDNIIGTADDNIQLQAGSPCIDTGDNEAVPIGVTTDLDGNRRMVDGNGDIETETDPETKLLLHFDGGNGQTTTTDSSPQSHAITLLGLPVPQAHLDTAFYKEGTASLRLDGSNDYASSPDSVDWDICGSSTDYWTIDFWAKFTDHTGTETIISQYADNSNRWSLTHIDGTGWMFIARSGGVTKIYSSGGGEITDSDWHHTALCKVGPEYAIYVDGTQINYTSDTDTAIVAALLAIGRRSTNEYFDGYLDELRINHSNIFGAAPNAGLTDTITNKDISITVDMGAYELWDSDGDGIEEGIDTEPTVYSNEFNDGGTSGVITDRGDQILIITDEPAPRGVRIRADASGGDIAATVSTCGDSTYTLNRGEVAGDDEGVITCGSVEIEVVSGIIEITLVPVAGPAATTSLSAGNSLTFEEDTFTVTVPLTNTDIVVIVIDGEEFALAPGESLTFNQPPVANAGADQIVYAWINGMAEVTLDGSDSNDPDGDELTYYWSWVIDGNTYEANGVNPTIELPVGEHTIELIVNDGLVDSEADYVDVNVIASLKGKLEITPCVINRDGHKCHKPDNILAFIRLPDGITRGDIDNNEPLILYPGGIEASRQWIVPCGYGKCKQRLIGILAFFDKDAVLDAVQDNGRVELQVVGRLKSGQYFYGSDTIRIIDRRWWPWCWW